MVSMPRNQFIAMIVGVCVLSAGIGSGLALIAQEGPTGATGERGPTGPRGPQGAKGPSGAAEIGGLEAEVEELRGEVEAARELEGRLEDLEAELSGSGSGGGITDELCEELGEIC